MHFFSCFLMCVSGNSSGYCPFEEVGVLSFGGDSGTFWISFLPPLVVYYKIYLYYFVFVTKFKDVL